LSPSFEALPFEALLKGARRKKLPSRGTIFDRRAASSKHSLGESSSATTEGGFLFFRGLSFFSSSPEEKGSGTPKGADFSTAATVVAARVLPDAFAFRRSTAVLASGI
jgi:hypothetical protein